MNISANHENSNKNTATFNEIEQVAFDIGMNIARQLIKVALEQADLTLMAERNVARYRNKGLRKTCIKTICGSVEFERRVYEDKVSPDKHFVYLLDEKLGIGGVGLISESVCKLIATSICESTYRSTSRQITELTGLDLSPQAVWNVVQELGENQNALAERNSELAEEKQGKGSIETPILYEENDGIWVRTQGKDRKENGPTKEMKLGIAYDGALYQESASGTRRRILDNKIAYAGFMPIQEFRKKKEGLIASIYDVSSVELRVINGDGASWIQKKNGEKCICVLDEFHRNKKITECVKNKEHAKKIYEVLFEGDYDKLLEYIEAVINSVEDEDEIKGLQELYRYYNENKEALPGYYDRGIEIPKTRDPGTVHHARLGSMESNVFTLIGNRMKGRRRNWSISGANNLASILCAYHTIGFEKLFAVVPAEPIPAPEWVDTGKPLSANQVREYTGKGYEYPASSSLSSGPSWLKSTFRIAGLTDLNFI